MNELFANCVKTKTKSKNKRKFWPSPKFTLSKTTKADALLAFALQAANIFKSNAFCVKP